MDRTGSTHGNQRRALRNGYPEIENEQEDFTFAPMGFAVPNYHQNTYQKSSSPP